VEGYTIALMTSLQSCGAAVLPVLLPVAASSVWLFSILPHDPLPPSVAVLIAMLIFMAGSLFIRVFLNPAPPAKHFLKAEPAYCRALGKHLYGLLMLILIAMLFHGLGIREILSHEQWHMARAVFLSVAVFILLWLVIAMRKAPAPFNSRKLQALLMLVLVVSLGAELFGYRNLSVYLLGGLVGTTLLGSVLWVTNVLLLELFDGLDEGRFGWEQRLRDTLRLDPEEPVPGLIWLRLLTTLTIWLAFIAGFIILWGYDESVWTILREGFTGGFHVAGMQIVPINLIIAIVVFALLITLVRWIRNEVLPGWVDRTRISHGAKEAAITISGYIGIIIAALIGLSLAGFNFTNLAIVVGALSVGIGFGLQNIVNNFISGIILLFERPIRTGDWIVTANTEGYVRKISIRSTQIETFDRADVIVPNSELISNQVTNWMLRDPMGRVIVPIGVAYGSDVERLRALLLQVANEHPLVMKDSVKVGPPKVLFRGFGDSSLNFELRAFISQVDRRLDTLSELNFAIERTLREAGIQIPFPQRDLHLRSADPSVGIFTKPQD
jgi:small-conductance mechanosensitive channel